MSSWIWTKCGSQRQAQHAFHVDSRPLHPLARTLTRANSYPHQDDAHALGEGWDVNGLPRFVTCREADYVIAEAEVMVETGEHSQVALDAARAEAEARVLAFIQDELCADPGTGACSPSSAPMSPFLLTTLLHVVSHIRAFPFRASFVLVCSDWRPRQGARIHLSAPP